MLVELLQQMLRLAGDSATITDPSIIQHKISIKTKGTAAYLEYNAQEKV